MHATTTMPAWRPYRYKHWRELRDAGVPYEVFAERSKLLAWFGITAFYNRRRRQWYFSRVARPGSLGPDFCALFCGVGAFVDWLRAPGDLLREFQKQEAMP